MAGIEGLVKSALGSKVYISEIGTQPTAADQIKGLKGISGGPGFSTDTVDATELDNDGFSKMVPTLKSLAPVTLTINKRDQATFKKVFDWAKLSTSDDKYFKLLTVVYPKSQGFTEDGFQMIVFLSNWTMGDATTSSVVDYTIELTGQDGITAFNSSTMTPGD